MKILFVCGSIEPGKDGVGDYTRRLAGELNKLSHFALIIALYDRFVSKVIREIQNSEGINFEVLRIPFLYSSKKRIIEAKKFIEQSDANWLSLQFVPFSFHKKGLSINIAKILYRIGEGKRWHIMFHELWVGMNIESSIKYKVWGHCQRYLLKLLVHKLKPKVVHTQTALYQLYLDKIGISAEYLPLFSNIPFISKSTKKKEKSELWKSNKMSMVLFGSIHKGGFIHSLACEVSQYAKKYSLKSEIIFIGRSGAEELIWARIFKVEGISVKSYGQQPLEFISEKLTSATFGISTTPKLLAEKSGTIAAMREHGLSVLCVSSKWTSRNLKVENTIPEIFDYSEGKFEEFILKKKYVQANLSIRNITLKFMETLTAQ